MKRLELKLERKMPKLRGLELRLERKLELKMPKRSSRSEGG